jgi:catechol 2,3-dioxygenase-like lactoylglutathione lyase family enzyme
MVQASPPLIFQVCVVVADVHQANANWAKVLGRPAVPVETIFPEQGILHFTHGQAMAYTDCQVAKYALEGFVLELIQPGAGPSPWREFLEARGQGVFHVCLRVEDRADFQRTLSEIGVGQPYHIGYFPQGSYSYVDANRALGLALSINHSADHGALMQALAAGTAAPFDEWK